MKTILLYGHGSSLNHGCEAIVKTTVAMLESAFVDKRTILSTLDYKNDKKAFLEVDQFIRNREASENFFFNVLLMVAGKLFPALELGNIIRYRAFYREAKRFSKDMICFSVGGDNYCTKAPRWLYRQNRKLDRLGCSRVLWGCSIEPETLSSEMMADLNGYRAIFVRESITKQALIEKGYHGHIYSHADPAFTLSVSEDKIPAEMKSGKWIGVNLSPVVLRSETNDGVTYENYVRLINYILEKTEYNVALIPHVVLENNSDYDAMGSLYNAFKDSGRVLRISNTYTASEYKGIISNCELFIGARTHATIAAYSTCVPTLVMGYSVKAKGIAKDLFGTYDGYVLPVQELQNKDSLTNAFVAALARLEEDRQHLQKTIPSIIQSSHSAVESLKKEFNL